MPKPTTKPNSNDALSKFISNAASNAERGHSIVQASGKRTGNFQLDFKDKELASKGLVLYILGNPVELDDDGVDTPFGVALPGRKLTVSFHRKDDLPTDKSITTINVPEPLDSSDIAHLPEDFSGVHFTEAPFVMVNRVLVYFCGMFDTGKRVKGSTYTLDTDTLEPGFYWIDLAPSLAKSLGKLDASPDGDHAFERTTKVPFYPVVLGREPLGSSHTYVLHAPITFGSKWPHEECPTFDDAESYAQLLRAFHEAFGIDMEVIKEVSDEMVTHGRDLAALTNTITIGQNRRSAKNTTADEEEEEEEADTKPAPRSARAKPAAAPSRKRPPVKDEDDDDDLELEEGDDLEEEEDEEEEEDPAPPKRKAAAAAPARKRPPLEEEDEEEEEEEDPAPPKRKAATPQTPAARRRLGTR